MKKIGIDLGGTTIKGALFDGDNIIEERSVPTHGSEGREAIFAALFSLLDGFSGKGAEAIGVSSAGNIDPVSGRCVYATDNLLGWTGADIKGEIERRYGLPCKADNDAVCALKGELAFYPRVKDATMLTFGTGVGGASVVCGNVLRGARFQAARWGHVCLDPHGRDCNCGKRGCAEAYLSATALLREGKKRIPALESCKELFERYRQNDSDAQETIAEFGFYLNVLLDTILTSVAPELIIFGGGVAESKDVLERLVVGRKEVVFAKLGNRAGVYGAVSEWK